MNQHNEHILLKYAQTEQAQRAHAAEAWQAANSGTNSHILKTGALSVAAVAVILVVLMVALM